MYDRITMYGYVKKGEAKMKKDSKWMHKFALGLIAAICVLLLIYFAFYFLFQTHYFFRTTIDEIEGSGQTVDTIAKILDDEFQKYALHVVGREGVEVYITASDVSLVVDTQEALQEILESQNAWLWPLSVWKNSTYELDHIGQLDVNALEEIVTSLPFMQTENMKAPQNAYIGDFQESEGQYELVEAYQGTFLKKGKVYDCIQLALENMDTELNLEEAGCYINPSVTSENEKLQSLWSELNREVSSQITYVFGDKKEIVDASLIHNWLIHINNTVYVREEEVSSYIKELARTYDTAYRKHEFTTSDGKEIVIDSGFYGWRMNRAEETQKLIESIKLGAVEEREPIYIQTAASHGERDYGDTYVEINLSKQHLYFWEKGNIIIESDFVSGNMVKGMGTPGGIFPITYKERNAVLKGTNYNTPVSYWMPFNGGIGMHDAQWRKVFGGTIYETKGSHGCINLPLEVAKEIYEHVEAGMPVICYYE